MMDPCKPPTGLKMKARAPPPPQVPQPAPQPAPRRLLRNAESLDGTHRDVKENMLSARVELRLTLPSGAQTSVTQDGSTALMDVLVELCSRYHLNPSLHTLELFTPEGHPLGFKPNVLLGSLHVARVLIKEKVLEERLVRRPAPRVPQKTVRLLVNYHGSQKAVVRVNPEEPLKDLLPVVCDKCDLDPALVLLLKDNSSRQQLPLDKSLSQLGIKELYVHDKSLDSIRSSTNSLARAEKKGLLGIFQFSRRKSKTSSLDMEDYDCTHSQSTDAQANAVSSLFGSPYVDERPHAMVQSQSAVNISRMSPKADTKKRRAPAPPAASTTSTEHPDCDTNQMGFGSESQQRKRKAPAPPPTPESLASDDTSAAATPVSLHAPMPRPGATPEEPSAPFPLPSRDLRPSTPSSTTSESLAVQDSSSELGGGTGDSDTGSTGDTGSTVSGPAHAQSYVSRTERSEATSDASDLSTAGSSTPDTKLKVEETENNRHSAVESVERPVPAKPRRSPGRGSLSRSVSTDSDPKAVEEAGPHSWLHSAPSSAPTGHTPEASTEETVSLGSGSSGSSLPDQGYAASEGTADGDDSGLVSSPSETQTASPDGSLSLDGSAAGDKRPGTTVEQYTDSDEGSWGPRHRSRDVTALSSTDRLQHQDLSAQLHRTLADLESSLRDTDEVPVSIMDHDVPVTTIDEVLPDEGFWAESITINASSFSDELQNRNNNAHTAADSAETKPLPQHKHKEKSKTHHKQDTPLEPQPKEIKKPKPSTEAKCNGEEQKNIPKPEEKRQDIHHIVQASKPLQSKITPNVTSRFGMKTFTVVPPKPAIAQAAVEERASVSPGAIKIDEQGNMVKVFRQRPADASQLKNGQDSPLLGKAKAFWSSNEKQEGKGLADKARDSLDCHKSSWSKTSESAQRSLDVGSLKTSQTEPKETVEEAAQLGKDSDAEPKDDDKVSASFKTVQSNPRPAPPQFIADVRRDLTFLKPSRRTSSQYVASAITKYAPKTAFKPDFNHDFHQKSQNFQKSGKSIQVNPQNSFRSSNANGPAWRSAGQSEHSREEEGTDETKNGLLEGSGFGKGGFAMQETKTPASSAQLTVKVSDAFRPVHRRSPSPSPSRAPHSFDKPAQALKQHATVNQVTSASSNLQSSEEKPLIKDSDSPQTAPCPAPCPAPSPAPCPAPSPAPCPAPCPPAVTVFGPVKKFKPVICRSVEKETSLHSSLMEAIQNGGGRERLKKISSSGAHMKKPSYVEEENERSALMAAIRAQGSAGRLRKTKCEAAEELETIRKSAVAVDVSSSSASASSPPQLQSSISPSSVAPPPPPPVLPAPKFFPLPRPDQGLNPASAREAMLEAIRSGSAAGKLKKVAAPAKTVQVNGRLGTMKATSSSLS